MTLINRIRLYRMLRRQSPPSSRLDQWRFTGGCWEWE